MARTSWWVIDDHVPALVGEHGLDILAVFDVSDRPGGPDEAWMGDDVL